MCTVSKMEERQCRATNSLDSYSAYITYSNSSIRSSSQNGQTPRVSKSFKRPLQFVVFFRHIASQRTPDLKYDSSLTEASISLELRQWKVVILEVFCLPVALEN